MRLRLTLVLTALVFCLVACASGQKAQRAGDDATASRAIFAPADMVLKAAKLAMSDYGLRVIETKALGPKAWSLKTEKGPACEFPEEIERVVVQDVEDRKTMVHFFIKRGFLGRWSGEPAWADAIFTR
ncbi:MAG: hypothetical protein SV487_11620, partial [Thermodesulfobacteriota bacterium]|nr:hypothetical protein [Thermodesulfobacteriota bacterium]